MLNLFLQNVAESLLRRKNCFLGYKFWPICSPLGATRPLWAYKGGQGAEDLDDWREVKNGLESLEGTRTN